MRVSAAGAWLAGTLSRFGTDIGQLDAVALRASFGEMCTWGTLSRYNQCVDFNDRERAPEYYASWSVEDLLDKVEEGVLYAEARLNAEVQTLHQRGLRLISDGGGPQIAAAGYGARGSLYGAKLCEACHRTVRGNKYGTADFAALSASSTVGGYVVAEQWAQLHAYQGLPLASRAFVTTDEDGAQAYWAHLGGDVASCVSLCDASGECAGFVHQRSAEWSCG